jgi:hypothetical protein
VSRLLTTKWRNSLAFLIVTALLFAGLDPKRCEQSGDPGEWDIREIGDLASKDLCR